MGFAYRPTTKGRYVIERRINPALPWTPVQGCDDAEAAAHFLDWYREHHAGSAETRVLDSAAFDHLPHERRPL